MAKKWIVTALIALCLISVVIFTGCGKSGTETPATLSIEFEGVNDVEVAYDSVFNVLDGVKASGSDGVDYSDKTTYSTTSSAINKETNILDTKQVGVHAVRYEVVVNDTVARKFRYITVTGPTAVEGQMLINAEFADGTGGWDDPAVVYIADGASMTLSSEDGALKADVVAGTNSYTPRFGQMNVPFENGKTYEVSFDAKSSVEKMINLNAGELLSEAPYFVNFLATGQIEHRLITTEWARHSFKITMTQDNPRGGILFELGAVDGNAVNALMYFDNVSIEESTPDPDVTGPVLDGVQKEVSIQVDGSFKPLDGVTAADVTDGDVTNQIVYSIYKEGSDTALKKIDTSSPALYIIVYYVKDSLGNFTIERTKLNIVDQAFADTGLIINGDFAGADLTPWSSWWQDWGDVPNASVNLVNGAVEITADKGGDANWAIQFKQPAVNLTLGKTYLLRFDAKASVARDINAVFFSSVTNINYLEPSSIMLGTEFKTIELMFTMTNDSIAAELQFLLGNTANFAPGTVTIDNVALLEADDSGPDVTAPTFSGVREAVTITSGDNFDLLAGITALDLKDGDVTNNISYSISKDGTSVEQLDTSVTGVYTITYSVKDASDNTATDQTTLTIVDIAFKDTGKIVNGDFAAADLTPWTSWWQNWGDMPNVTVNLVDGAAEITTDKGGDANWAIQFSQSNVELVQGKTYKLTFDAKSSVARDINAVLYNADVNINFLESGSVMLGTDFKTVELMFTMTNNTNIASLQFLLGNTANFAAGTVTIDNVALLEVDEEAIVFNSNFDFLGWRTFSNFWEGTLSQVELSEQGTLKAKFMSINTSSDPNNNWQLQVIQDQYAIDGKTDNQGSIFFEAGKTYKATFDVRATKNGNVNLAIGNGLGGWVPYYTQSIAVTTEFQTISVEFTLDDGNMTYADAAQFKFEMGNLFSGEVTDQSFELDNVGIAVKNEDNSYSSTSLITNGTMTLPVGWNLYVDGQASASMAVSDGILLVSCVAIGSEPWHVHLYNGETSSLKPGRYRVVMGLTSTETRNVRFNVTVPTQGFRSLLEDPYHVDIELIEDTLLNFEMDFEVTESLDGIVKIELDLGNLNSDVPSVPFDLQIDKFNIFRIY